MIRMPKAGPGGPLRCTLFLLVLSIAAPSRASTGDACWVLGQQIRGLSREEIVILQKNGFAIGLDLPDHLPGTVISKRVVPDCEARLIAERYFDNKISGEQRFAIERDEFARSRAAVAQAACKALTVSEPWPDGVSHEVLNVVSDALFPEWSECLYRRIVSDAGRIDLRYFTAASFQRPPQKIRGLIRESLGRKGLDTLDVALLLFLEKNLMDTISLGRAKRALMAATPMNDQELSNQEIIDRALRLLAKRRPVSLEEAWTLESETYGSWT